MKKLIALLLTAALALSLAACGSSSQSAASAAPAAEASSVSVQETTDPATGEKVLAVAISAAAVTAHPIDSMDNNSQMIGYALYDSLLQPAVVELDGYTFADKAHPEPCLAESWEISDDGLTYTFHLREDVQFANGDPLTTEAIKATIEYCEGKFLYSMAARIQSYEIIDDYHFSFTLSAPNRDFLPCMTNFRIYNPKQLPDGDTDWLSTNSAGTGAYVLTQWDPSADIILTRNENYFGGTPYYDKIIITYVPEVSNHTALLQSGDVDLSLVVESKDLDTLAANPNLSVLELASNKIAYLTLNSSLAPFDDPLVRQAILYAIPYDSLVSDVMEGHASKMISCSPIALDGTIEAQPYSYDPEKAKELLAQAGYADGLEFTISYSAGYPDYEAVATVVQSELAKIGVTVKLNKIEYSALIEDLDNNKAEAFINVWTPYMPSNLYHLNCLFPSNATYNKYTRLNNARVDELLSDIDFVDDAEYFSRIAEIQQIVADEAIWGYLYQYNNVVVAKSSINGPLLAADNVPRLALLTE